MAVGEILDTAMGLLRRYPGATMGFSALVTAVQMVFFIPAQWLTREFVAGLLDPTASGPSDGDLFLGLFGLAAASFLTSLVAGVCAGVVGGGAAVVVGEATFGRSVTLGEVWARLRPRFWSLLALSLLIALATAAALATIFPAWFFLVGVLAVAAPAFVLERVGVIEAIRRSWRLTISDFLRVLGIRLLAITVATVLQLLVTLPLLVVAEILVGTLAGPGGPGSGLLLGAAVVASVGTYVTGVVITPFLGCVDALLYTDRRMRAEGFDIEIGLNRRQGVG